MVSEALIGLLGVSYFGALGWAYQVSGRLTAVETEYQGLRDLIETRFKEVNRRLDQIDERL